MTVQLLSADLFIESMTFHQRIFCMKDFQTFSYAHRFGDINFNFNSHVNNILDVIELDEDEKYDYSKIDNIYYWHPIITKNLNYNISNIIEELKLNLDIENSMGRIEDTVIDSLFKIEDYLVLLDYYQQGIVKYA